MHSLDEITAEALKLPVSSRATLADRLVESLDWSSDDGLRGEWINEAVRRSEDLKTGKVQAISADEVFAEVRRVVGR
jgi:putative addiction module component (TIGR02574 family)